jgi:thioredoxin-related protein
LTPREFHDGSVSLEKIIFEGCSMLKKSLLLFWIMTGFLMAEIHWQPSYAQAKETAVKENKPMMVILVSHSCRWCQRLKNRTLNNPKVTDYVNRHFVPVIVYRGEGNYPDFITSARVPTTFFLSPDEEFLTKPWVGYQAPNEFLYDLKAARKAFLASRKLPAPR